MLVYYYSKQIKEIQGLLININLIVCALIPVALQIGQVNLDSIGHSMCPYSFFKQWLLKKIVNINIQYLKFIN